MVQLREVAGLGCLVPIETRELSSEMRDERNLLLLERTLYMR
jgi:hypothetical protein